MSSAIQPAGVAAVSTASSLKRAKCQAVWPGATGSMTPVKLVMNSTWPLIEVAKPVHSVIWTLL